MLDRDQMKAAVVANAKEVAGEFRKRFAPVMTEMAEVDRRKIEEALIESASFQAKIVFAANEEEAEDLKAASEKALARAKTIIYSDAVQLTIVQQHAVSAALDMTLAALRGMALAAVDVATAGTSTPVTAAARAVMAML